MDSGYAERERRPVLVNTARGSLEGELDISTALRTLDDLNLLHHTFITLENPVVLDGDWSLEPTALVLNTSSIRFVVEKSNRMPTNLAARETARFSRSAVRMHVGDHEIHGFLHVPGQGSPLARLKQDKHQFLALTSASVTGPDTAFASSFVAVNRAHILAAQELRPDDEFDDAGCDLTIAEAASVGGPEGEW